MNKIAMMLMAMMLAAQSGQAQPQQTITVVVKEGQDIRALAREYLNDPDMWNEILKANKLASAAAIQPGMSLRIPATDVSRAAVSLARAGEAIEQATQAGAQIFAADTIARAIDLRNQAMARRRAGQWAECMPLAESARREAELAISRSQAKRHVVAEAVLSERKGIVQSRGSAEVVWADALVNSKLKEGQRVRTLADSSAEVRFSDGSRLRLNENSQAVIQRMRSDLYEKKQEQSVSLIEGDASALLEPGGRQRNKFALLAGGAQTQVRSTKFWIKKEAAGTRFANYEGELEVSSGGKSVILKANQGATVQADSKLSAPRDLLPAPPLKSPANEATSSARVTLTWDAVKDARGYWLEIATDSAFKKIVRNRKEVRDVTVAETGLADGIYFWRVAAIDVESFPGPKSEERAFRVFKDETPPYLALHSPVQNARLRTRSLTATGEVEPGATLQIGGRAVNLDPAGKFSTEITLTEAGIHTLALVATDAAGNVSTLNRSVLLMSDAALDIRFDASMLQPNAGHFLVPDRAFTISGRTEPGAAIQVSDASGSRARTYADPAGDFRVVVGLSGDKEELTLTVSLEGLKPREQKLAVEVDSEPPQLTLRTEPPAVTTDAEIRLEGTATGAKALSVNGKDAPHTGDAFGVTIPLRPGPNQVRIVAVDLVGNAVTLTRDVILDQQPPRLVSFSVTPKLAAGGERIQIRVIAEDESALREAARFTVQVGSFVHTGFLKLQREEKAYLGVVSLPDTAQGSVKLTSILLHDYHGNFKEYQPK